MEISNFDCKKQLNFLSSGQKAELSRHFSKPGETAMPHQLAVRLGISISDALAIIAVLETHNLSKNRLLIYHECEPELAADTIPYGIGFPDLPWKCPHCEEIVDSYDELDFDVIAKAQERIKFI
jgi:hypothetical protein